MLDNLVMAYRSQIYDWNLSRWKGFFKSNKLLMVWLGIFVLLFGISVVTCLKSNSSLVMLFVLIGECIIAVFLDRYVVNQYQKYILGKQLHIEKTVVFLKTVLPEKDLFSNKHIEELIERLTLRIEARSPFKSILSGLKSFAKAIVLPAITYVAGVFSGKLVQLDFITVASWTISIVILLGITSLALNGVFIMIRLITCRDYDAAIALREDLRDIRLMHFSDQNT